MTGVYAQTVLQGDIVYLQSKHFDESGRLSSDLHPDLKSDLRIEKHLLKSGDVLFAAKGTKNFAALISKSIQPAVASTSFFVIRIHTENGSQVLPEYLTWFLNRTATQRILKAEAVGSSLPSISMPVISQLEIPIPTLSVQNNILLLNKHKRQEKYLREKIAELRSLLIETQITSLLNI